ncbi:hypothetical protein KTF61_15100, partial [Faecalibacterium prausnitzii]
TIKQRRRTLIILTLAIWLLNLNHAVGVLGLAGGSSFLWFGYLFAMGDWLGSDQALLQSLKTGWLMIGDLLVFLAMCLAAWFNINQLS